MEDKSIVLEDKDIVLDDICKRLSLRPPQAESLKRLAAAVDAAGLKKGADEAALEEQLAAVRALFPKEQYPEVDLPPAADFDWSFLSFAFALATGVGKTRLMGAIIAYLYRVKGLRNFLVIAPGTTIYQKLVADFTEGTPKYVFKGLECFATKKPVVVTGDTYQGGAGMMEDPSLFGHSIAINIFNIQKLTEKGESHDDSQKDVARIRRLNERIGQSYFDYLKGCGDLVVLMDEAHHYRADAGAATINDLQPVLGIEMTATPRANGRRFGNVLCEYGLAKAMKDGFVKEPAVVRRQNYRKEDWVGRERELDRRKLDDAAIVHEAAKAALAEYAARQGVAPVKPFMLVVAPDTAYADEIEAYLKSGDYLGGKYADRVVKVDYKAKKSDEAIARLLDIERPGNKVEIVVHVNMLGEGWDVSNLFTIVPLRAANSETLVEQTIGRGLRLPYGKRTGVAEVDTLSIVSHDNFEKIVAAARNMQIEMRVADIPPAPKKTVVAAPVVVSVPAPAGPPAGGETAAAPSGGTADANREAATQEAIRTVGELVETGSKTGGIDISSPDVRATIETGVAKKLEKSGTAATSQDVSDGVAAALRLIRDAMIEIPQILIEPGATSMKIAPFELDREKLRYSLRDDKLVYDYVTDRRIREVRGDDRSGDATPEVKTRHVRNLIAAVARFDDIPYDTIGPLVGHLCETCIDELGGHLDGGDLENCMRNNLRTLAEEIRSQILAHAGYDSAEDRVIVQAGSLRLAANPLSIDSGEQPRPFSVPLPPGEKSKIRSMAFTGFKKCLFTFQKFDSEPERAFSELLEREPSVLKWFKPTLSNLRLYYGPNEYTPDFVFETPSEKCLCEVKAVDKTDDAVVLAKQDAALKWCHYANQTTEAAGGGKPWRYLLVPDSVINGSLTLSQVLAEFDPAKPKP